MSYEMRVVGYRLLYQRKNDAALRYIVEDCTDAIQAMPDGPNVLRYCAQREAANVELGRRMSLRHYRETAKKWRKDPLLVPLVVTLNGRRVATRNLRNNARAMLASQYELSHWRDAAFSIGLLRLEERRSA